MDVPWLENDFPRSLAADSEGVLQHCAQAYAVQCELESASYCPDTFTLFAQKDDEISGRLKACVALEAELAALGSQPPAPALDASILEQSSMEALGVRPFKLAAHAKLMRSAYDVVAWYGGTEDSPPESPSHYLLHSGHEPKVIPLSDAQYYLLQLMNESDMLAEAFDRFVREYPAHASTSAPHIGEWLKFWLEKGIFSA